MGQNAQGTVTVRFGDDAEIKPAATSQRKQGSVAFLRSATLSVNGKAIKPPTSQPNATPSFRLNAAQDAALRAILTKTPNARSVVLPLVKRGRPSGAMGLAAYVKSASTTTTRARTTRAPKAPAAAAPAAAAE